MRRHSQTVSFNEPQSLGPSTFTASIKGSNYLQPMSPPLQANSISNHTTPRVLDQPFVPDHTPRAYSSIDAPQTTSGIPTPLIIAPPAPTAAPDAEFYLHSPTSVYGDPYASSIFSSSPTFSTSDQGPHLSGLSTAADKYWQFRDAEVVLCLT